MTANSVLPSSIKMGFTVLSHTANPLHARLLSKLNQLYDFPPIVIHHDFFQSPFPLHPKEMSSNVVVLKRYCKTRWGTFSLINAFLLGLQELYEKHCPDWFSNLSVSCYPVADGPSVLSELSKTPYDAFLGSTMVYPELQIPCPASMETMGEILLSPALPTHTSDVASWLDKACSRYVHTEHTGTLFGPQFGCFVGAQWFTGNAKAADILIGSRRELPNLFHHYANVHAPDESFCQTVLCNHKQINICKNNRRFVNWHTKGMHPLDLTLIDYPRIVESRCYFARKVSLEKSNTLLDALDRLHTASAP
jgi:hypothetical protein